MNKVGPHGESVGESVHYVHHTIFSDKDELLAAIIVKVNDNGTVNLAVFNAEGTEAVVGPICNVRFSESPQPRCWSWPVRVP